MLHEPGINAMVSNFRDISEKITGETEKEFDSNNLNALINNTNDLMWSVDRDFNPDHKKQQRHRLNRLIKHAKRIVFLEGFR